MVTVTRREQNCIACPIRHRAVCATCDSDELRTLESIKSYRSFSAGQTIVWADDALEFVASIVSGSATIERMMEDGRKQTLGLLLPSDFIGRPGRDRAFFTVTALSDVVLCCFRRRQFEALVRDTPHIAERLLEMTLDELDAARDWMLLLGRKTARERIASFLMMLHRRLAPPAGALHGASVLELPLTREAMADYLGLTIETVSRQLTRLRHEGLIEIEGRRRLTIPDPARLAEETGTQSRPAQ